MLKKVLQFHNDGDILETGTEPW